MEFKNDEKKSMSSNGWKESAYGSNKWHNGSSTITRTSGGSTIFTNGGHGRYGRNMSETSFKDRSKK